MAKKKSCPVLTEELRLLKGRLTLLHNKLAPLRDEIAATRDQLWRHLAWRLESNRFAIGAKDRRALHDLIREIILDAAYRERVLCDGGQEVIAY